MTEQSPAEAIFFAALEKGTAEERIAYVNAACGDDSNLRRACRTPARRPSAGRELSGTAGPTGDRRAEAPRFRRRRTARSRSGPAETMSHDGPSEGVGSVIAGRYKLLETLGQGGMGAVFMAQQTEPVKRLVALEAHQTGHGLPANPGPIRGRAAGAGADGSSEYRQGAGRGSDRLGPAVLRDGAGQGRTDHPLLR